LLNADDDRALASFFYAIAFGNNHKMTSLLCLLCLAEEASKIGLLKLAQRMTSQLCSSLSSSSTWTTLSGSCNGEDEVRVMTREYSSLSQTCNVHSHSHSQHAGGSGNFEQIMPPSSSSSGSSGIVLSAATSIWLPASPQHVFEFLTTSRREVSIVSQAPMNAIDPIESSSKMDSD
jgi:hypothetical protein